MTSAAVLIYLQHLIISYQSRRSRIIAGQIAPENKRRTEDAPQRHERLLLVGSQLGWRATAFFRGDTQSSQRKHIGIGPGIVLGHILRPIACVVELFLQ